MGTANVEKEITLVGLQRNCIWGVSCAKYKLVLYEFSTLSLFSSKIIRVLYYTLFIFRLYIVIISTSFVVKFSLNYNLSYFTRNHENVTVKH